MTQCRFLRMQLGLSQETLAVLAGVPQPYVSKIERRVPDVMPEDLEAVARVLGIDADALVREASPLER